MIERLKFDLLYIENMSLAMDFKIPHLYHPNHYPGQG